MPATPLLHQIDSFYEKYERRIGVVFFIGGFIFDNLTLQRVDLLLDNIVIMFYLLISGGGIAWLYYYHNYLPQSISSIRINNLLPLGIQFAFGGLFSSFFIFYTQSSTFASGWPFVLLLLALLIGNEFFVSYYRQLTFQISVYFTAVFSFFIFFIPILSKTIGATTFVFSGLVSLVFIYLFSLVLFATIAQPDKGIKIILGRTILTIFVTINILYFTNLIPPIPLSLKNAGVYYSIEKTGSNYYGVGAHNTRSQWLSFLLPEKIVIEEGQSLSVFSAVFAPTDLGTKIVHDWQYLDEQTGRWVSVTKITFSILGGRDGGYRGFSTKENLFGGQWRVDVKTERNQIIGRVRFNIETGTVKVEFEKKIL